MVWNTFRLPVMYTPCLHIMHTVVPETQLTVAVAQSQQQWGHQ